MSDNPNSGLNIRKSITNSTQGKQLISAVKKGDAVKVGQLVTDSDLATINYPDTTGKTPLYWACVKNFLNIVEELLSVEANPNILDYQNDTPLRVAAQKGNVEIVQRLVDAGADPNIIHVNGTTPLLIACQEHQWGVVEYLASLPNCHVNVKSRDGPQGAAIHYALANSQLESIKLLIAHPEIDLLQADSRGRCPHSALIPNQAMREKVQSLIDERLNPGMDPSTMTPQERRKRYTQSVAFDMQQISTTSEKLADQIRTMSKFLYGAFVLLVILYVIPVFGSFTLISPLVFSAFFLLVFPYFNHTAVWTAIPNRDDKLARKRLMFYKGMSVVSIGALINNIIYMNDGPDETIRFDNRALGDFSAFCFYFGGLFQIVTTIVFLLYTRTWSQIIEYWGANNDLYMMGAESGEPEADDEAGNENITPSSKRKNRRGGGKFTESLTSS